MITRLRPTHSADELARLYATPHAHGQFTDHVMRAAVTIRAGKALGAQARAADLSCGDGYILMCLAAEEKFYGDLAPGYSYTGLLEQTLAEIPDVDLYVCCETLEHLDDPAGALAAIREKASLLLLSTPVGAWDDANPEHYWAWSREDVEGLLAGAGWTPTSFELVACKPMGYQYDFGVWTAQ